MNNKAFLDAVNSSFQIYLKTGARSNKKLEVLHGFIARQIVAKLGAGYSVKSLGVGDNREGKISGRYVDKNVDITLYKDGAPVAGVAVKFVMSNYSQNSNNYFENMLGETANIRAVGIPYFQVLILTQNSPYFDKGGTITKIETITAHNIHKYIVMSGDDTAAYVHSPDKTLVYLVKASGDSASLVRGTRDHFTTSYSTGSEFTTCTLPDVEFDSGIIFNDFDEFADKVAYRILSL